MSFNIARSKTNFSKVKCGLLKQNKNKTKTTTTFAHFMKKSMHLKTGFLFGHQVLFLLLNGPQIEKCLQFKGQSERLFYSMKS